MPKIGIVPAPWWEPACKDNGVEAVALPIPGGAARGLYGADVRSRAQAGRLALQILQREPVDLIVDSGATGLTFVEGPGGFSELKLTHERAGAPLISHLTDPIHVLTEGLPWDVLWSCLGSRRWLKAVADAHHAHELRQFGIENVVHMPAAALEHDYDTTPIHEAQILTDVSFLGDSGQAIYADLPAETTEETARLDRFEADGPDCVSFYQWYHDVEHIDRPPSNDESAKQRGAKALPYFQMRIRHARRMCHRFLEKPVARLTEELGSRFRLTGRGWDEENCHHLAPFPKNLAEYLECFRTAAVNVNLWNGTSEGTINSQHFEITAAGGFLLCQDYSDVEMFFDVGTECDTFRGTDELLEKIHYYLQHPDRRQQIAQAGQRRTLRDHLYRNRLGDLLTIMERVKQRAASAKSEKAGLSPTDSAAQSSAPRPARPIQLNEARP
ncbi:MAG: glycosyltransferase [Phycisphaerales bacterium]|nr:MAG: glycosyltransferase [Phycisphaerales bacterium]